VVRSNLVVSVRYQCHLIGLDGKYQLGKRINGISLDVELCRDEGANVTHILIANVAFVRTGMHRNALSTKDFCVTCYCQHIRVVATSCVAQSGYFIDIYT